MARLDTTAEVPRWALDAGLPAPDDQETLTEYALRVGIPEVRVDEWFAELDERTACIANLRFAEYLRSVSPKTWNAYHRARFRASHPYVRSSARRNVRL